LHPRLFQIGAIAVPTEGVLVALSILAALWMAGWTARRLALDPERTWNLCLTGIFTMLLGARLVLALEHPRDFLAHPFWMLGLVTVRSLAAFYGGLLLTICICFGYIFWNHLPLRRTLDCVAPAAALGLGIHAVGAFAGGSDYGTLTTAPWGVVYQHRLAWLWYGTPLGVRLHPVQLYEAAVLLGLFVVLVLLLPRSQYPGEMAALFLFVYGAELYFLDRYRGVPVWLAGGVLSALQAGGILCVLAGAFFAFRAKGA